VTGERHEGQAYHAEDDGHIRGRPISWAVVTVVIIGFIVAGIGLIVATPWVFYLGAGLVAAGTLIGWATHAMADPRRLAERRAARTQAAAAPVSAVTGSAGSGEASSAHALAAADPSPSPSGGSAQHIWP